MHRAKATFREFLVAAVASISGIAMGLALGWPSPMFQKLTEETLVENPIGYVIVESEQSWINSVLAIGGFFGPFVAGYVSDRVGRKPAHLLSSVIHIAGWSMLLLAKSVPLMIAARFVLGFGNGYILITLTIYIGEIASDEYRGILGSFLQIGQTVGILYVYCIGPYVGYYAFQWICCAVPIAFGICFVYMPETPHYLISKGQHEKALHSLMYLRDATLTNLQQENAFRKLFTYRANQKAILISFCLLSFQQWTGIDCILSNSELIFAKARISLYPDISTIIIGTVQVICCIVTLFFVDLVGRKPVLMYSAVGLSISLALLGVYFVMEPMAIPTEHISWIPLTGMIGFIAIYNFGFGPVPWAIASEIFAYDVKALGSAINVSVTWILDFLALRFFLLISESIGFEWAFWIFALVCVAAFIFTWLFVIETKGLSLEEIQQRLGGKSTKEAL
ncbi:facilitated trehalose transporter Tret1-2 homolog [Wyeomyia smithii]|uniref:facilitated trehalose transporter Tret1-2 homolog n=1 Tax=Wyeomyia smithii TaxID=174621 RepID=UPI002467E32A|nr:facilitated trehalose transporter Tret1-2 homolog [Wyeomyia smithii]